MESEEAAIPSISDLSTELQAATVEVVAAIAALNATKTSEIYEALEEARQWGSLLPFARAWIVAEARRLEQICPITSQEKLTELIGLGVIPKDKP